MVRTKLMAKRWPITSRVVPWLMNRRERRKGRKSIKIKLTVPEIKTLKLYVPEEKQNILVTGMLETFNLINIQ